MSRVAIRAALETQLAAMSPALAIAWENQAFLPPNSETPYQKVNLLFATPENPEMGGGHRELGYLQITLEYPLQAGPADAEARADAIVAAFPKGLTLVSGGVAVNVDKTPAIGNGAPDGDRWALPVKISFHANIF